MRQQDIANWRNVKLKAVCREITVGHVGPMASQYVEQGIPFLRSQNIEAFRLNQDDVKYISDEFHAKLKKSSLRPGDLVVVRTGYPGTACVIPSDLAVANCADLVIIRPSNDIDAQFLASLFNSAWGQGAVAGNLVGVAQQHFNIGAAKEMVVLLPPLPTQQKIAEILSSYNDLIENNLRRIKILEEMAQNLYREWFVKFRFPGHQHTRFIDSPLGRIAEGWQVVTVEQIVKRVPSGMKYDQKTVCATGSVPVLDQGRTGIIGYHDDEPGVVASEDVPIIVFANHTCYQRLVMFPFSAIQNVLPFLSSPEYPRNIYWLHYATKDLVTFNDYKGHWPEFMAKVLILPLPNVCEQFGSFVETLTKQLFKLEKKNTTLRRTRDLLLPKLIAGEVDVSELDITIPEEVAA